MFVPVTSDYHPRRYARIRSYKRQLSQEWKNCQKLRAEAWRLSLLYSSHRLATLHGGRRCPTASQTNLK